MDVHVLLVVHRMSGHTHGVKNVHIQQTLGLVQRLCSAGPVLNTLTRQYANTGPMCCIMSLLAMCLKLPVNDKLTEGHINPVYDSNGKTFR